MLVVKPRTDFEPVHALLMESLSAKAVMSAVELKMFDYLEGREVEVSELADEMKLIPERLEPVLDILVAADLLVKNGGGYGNAPVASEFLVSHAPLYQGDSMALTMRFNATVEDSIATMLAGGEGDRAGTDEGWGMAEIMEGTAQDAKGGALSHVVDFVTELPGFDGFRSMCDIGGNHGMYTIGVLERNSGMNGVIYDLPHVVEQTGLRCEELGFSDRVTTQAMDFKEGRLPAETYDLALTSHVLYAFEDDLNGALKRIAEGLKPGGWFVSHHYAGRNREGRELTKASLELLTRLCGYHSHFIEQEELTVALESAGFGDIRFQPVSSGGLGLMTAARKLA